MIRVDEDKSSIYKLSEFVAKKLNVSLESIRSRYPGDRERHICQARQIAMWLYLDYYGNEMSLKSIGIFFGNRDHTTVLNARKQINNLMDSDKKFHRLIHEEIYPELLEYLESKTKISE